MSLVIPHNGEVCQLKCSPHWGTTINAGCAKGDNMGNNLKNLRKQKGWSHQQAADAMGVSRGQFIKLERSERKLTQEYIQRAAIVFNVSEADVFAAPKEAPIVGYVGAGSEAHYYDGGHPPDDFAPMPPGGTEQTVAVEVRGDSLGTIFNRWLVYYDDVRTPPTPDMLRKLCVVGLASGQVLVKMLAKGSLPGRYHLLSQTEGMIEDAEIIWAAEVRAMAPR